MDGFELYDSQEAHADFLTDSLLDHGCALDASDTGTGKTPVAVDIAWNLGRRPVVVCPKPVIPSWNEWIEQRSWTSKPIVTNYERIRTGRTELYQKRDGWTGLEADKDLLIFDEVQRCKGQSTQTKDLLIHSMGIPTLCLSATAASSPLHMKALGYRLGLFPAPNRFWNWARCRGCISGTWGGLLFVNGKRWMPVIHEEIKPFMSRMRREDQPEFPETMIVDDPIDFGSQLNKLWRELEAIIDSIPEGGQVPIVEILRARQEAELIKVPYTVELAKDALEAGDQVVVFLNFHASIDQVISGLREAGIEPKEYSGRTAKGRDAWAKDFREDRLPCLVAQNAAGGVGLNLHGRKPRTALHSPTWSANDHIQLLGRVHRSGGSKSYQRILTCGEDEQRVQKKCVKGCDLIDTFNNG